MSKGLKDNSMNQIFYENSMNQNSDKLDIKISRATINFNSLNKIENINTQINK